MKPQPDAAAKQRYEYNEYLIVLKPNESEYDKIQKIKEEFSKKYNLSVAGLSHPQIALARFFQFKTLERRIIIHLNTIARARSAFMVRMENFGSFPSHTIFINVKSKQSNNLVKELKMARKIMTMDQENKPHFITDPYFVIARKLLPWQYEQGWKEYSCRHFSGCFMAESMWLLKRPVMISANGLTTAGSYQNAAQFKFLNSPIAAVQSDLFA